MHIGCDPKADSSRLLVPGAKIVSVMGTAMQTPLFDAGSILMDGVKNITCLEAGGPEPGVGCAGRGITRMFELLVELDVDIDAYDMVVYDVLGDVVCGGFATPMKAGHAQSVMLVASGSTMSLFAANNIIKAVKRFQRNGVRLAGIVGNYHTGAAYRERLPEFAAATHTRVLANLPFDPEVQAAEERRQTICDFAPQGQSATIIKALAAELLADGVLTTPEPLSEEDFEGLIDSARTRPEA